MMDDDFVLLRMYAITLLTWLVVSFANFLDLAIQQAPPDAWLQLLNAMLGTLLVFMSIGTIAGGGVILIRQLKDHHQYGQLTLSNAMSMIAWYIVNSGLITMSAFLFVRAINTKETPYMSLVVLTLLGCVQAYYLTTAWASANRTRQNMIIHVGGPLVAVLGGLLLAAVTHDPVAGILFGLCVTSVVLVTLTTPTKEITRRKLVAQLSITSIWSYAFGYICMILLSLALEPFIGDVSKARPLIGIASGLVVFFVGLWHIIGQFRHHPEENTEDAKPEEEAQ